MLHGLRLRFKTFWGDVIICGLLCVAFFILWHAHGIIYDLTGHAGCPPAPTFVDGDLAVTVDDGKALPLPDLGRTTQVEGRPASIGDGFPPGVQSLACSPTTTR